jgi:flagellar motor switch/type III secretory pathway protein FliN
LVAPPKLSAFPWHQLPQLSRDQARAESLVARWLPPAPLARLGKLLKVDATTITARVVARSAAFDAHAATCVVKAPGAEIIVCASSTGVLALANRILGGPAELAAPRQLNVVEESVWRLVVATALEDLGLPGTVWPSSGNRTRGSSSSGGGCVELYLRGAELSFAIQLQMPQAALEHRPPWSGVPAWAEGVMIDVAGVIARCALRPSDLARIAVRSLVTVEGVAGVRLPKVGKPVVGGVELEIFGGSVGIRPKTAGVGASGGTPGVVAEVVSGYVPRAMSLPDDAHVELTVGLGTTQMSLRQIFELSVGQVVTLGRPLGGPFELRASGKLVGKGELVDVDGELAVRIVSLGDQE